MCSVCGTSENLWICLICGNVGCGRYKGGHAIEHWKETEHCYSLELETQKIVEEYNDLLTSQLDKQRNYYESLLSEVKEENEKEISAATSKAVSMMKLQKLQAKLDKCLEEKSFLDDINANLVKNQEMWKERVRKVQEREQAALKLKDEKIEKLEAELRDLIAHIECQNAVAAAPGSISSDIQGGTILPGPSTPSSSSSPVRPTKDRKRN
ncbi:unnamed protein product [Triticum turgidum subsp. durum]|uniref:UBP-type domain-containing protein n=1 Tax=Triticum turgidum subsp. durum TaxID=4567 RepID=A0A9R0XWK9_TRITD|nr:unnamed protein product [Triticum turgidum subsp. durum]